VSFDPDQYHRRSMRLAGYDYSQPGAYFITICTHGHACILGEVVEDGVDLSQSGDFVRQAWHALPGRFPRVELDEFVVMPNHVPGIIVITPDVPRIGVGAKHVGAIHA
jgi:putative transposase